jgi:hypothetical protein
MRSTKPPFTGDIEGNTNIIHDTFVIYLTILSDCVAQIRKQLFPDHCFQSVLHCSFCHPTLYSLPYGQRR